MAEISITRAPDDLAAEAVGAAAGAEAVAAGVPVLDAVGVDDAAPDVVVLLQPTSPLRRPEHVDDAVRLLADTGADSVVSVVEVPHAYRPDALMDVADGRAVPRGGARTREEKSLIYARNGPAVLALRADRLGDDLYAGDCRVYVMDERDSLDVDTPFDLELADLLLRAR